MVHGVEEKHVRGLESKARDQDSDVIKHDMKEKAVSVAEEPLKLREAGVKKLQEDLEKQDERVKELESTLKEQSAAMEQERTAMKELQEFYQKALEDSKQTVKMLTKELDEKKEEMKRLKDESSTQQNDISDLKQRNKELHEKAERDREERPAVEEGNSKLRVARRSLTEKEKANMDKVLQGNLVEVDYQKDSLKIMDPIQFKAIKHGEKPAAIFEDEGKAHAALQDVAKLLQVLKTAKVLIEGHTATPDDKLDGWSDTLAQNRAEVVMKQIGKFGVDKSRLSATGLPGKKGSGKHEVLIKVVEL